MYSQKLNEDDFHHRKQFCEVISETINNKANYLFDICLSVCFADFYQMKIKKYIMKYLPSISKYFIFEQIFMEIK